MKFLKGIIWGAAISAGAIMFYNGTSKAEKNKIMKKGKKIMNNLGMM